MRRIVALLVPFSLLLLLHYLVFRMYVGHMPDIGTWIVPIHVLGWIGLLVALGTAGRRGIDRGALANTLVSIGYIHILWIVLLTVFGGLFLLVKVLFGVDADVHWLIPFAIATIPFLALVYGTLFGKYRYKLEEVEVTFADLPSEFDGFKIVQISDAHSGTLDSQAGVQKGIDLINAQEADVILFTGDLVNASKDEIDPFIDQFATLSARYGKYAVLGNHDYYGQPRDRASRGAYYESFFEKYKQMGFDLILNDHREISKGDQAISLVGVENWGTGAYFPKRGDLDRATAGLPDCRFTVLMSHDPSHWDLKATAHRRHFHLTLSGHTHGMQFGINLPFFKWSPVQYRYKQWMGLYERAGQYLYVNRGFGMLAYAGRVGMSAEVTVLTLRSGNS